MRAGGAQESQQGFGESPYGEWVAECHARFPEEKSDIV
jgi:hypothetical protein